MAFNGIGSSLGRRRTNLEVLRRTTKGAAEVVRIFLEEIYGSTVARRCSVSYTQSTVTILVPAKHIANDLTLRSGELSAVIRAEKFPLKHIVIN